MKRYLLGGVIAALAVLVLTVDGRSQTSNNPGAPASSFARPEVVYVQDFLLDSGGATQDNRLLKRPRLMPQEDPQAKAAKLVELLSATLVKALQDKSIPAQRLYSGTSLPSKGWVIRGQFLEVDEGNRLRRAVIGFGAGAAEMQLEVEVTDLRSGGDAPFLVFGTNKKAGKGPGAIISKNPYVLAAKFVMSKKDPERDVKKTARQIADVIAKVIESGKI